MRSFISLTRRLIIRGNQQTRLFASSSSSLQRIERIISNRGVGSRSEVSKLLKQGRVTVNGKIERSSSNKYYEDVIIEIDGEPIQGATPLLAIFHKPVGILSSVGDPWGRPNLEGVYANHPSLTNMHPVGRLDADTSGLLLFSKEGKLTQHLLNPQSGIPRTYEAIVLGSVVHTPLKEVLNKGVQTTDGVFGGNLLKSQVLDNEVMFIVYCLNSS
jgi:16S rRNA U516 pseudouridylate synthase RsuA-like enzyme